MTMRKESVNHCQLNTTSEGKANAQSPNALGQPLAIMKPPEIWRLFLFVSLFTPLRGRAENIAGNNQEGAVLALIGVCSMFWISRANTSTL